MTVVPFHKQDDQQIGLYRLKHMRKDVVRGKLGFGPEIMDDPSKMRQKWQFLYEADGVSYHCGIWDYKGTKQEEELGMKKDFCFYGPLFIAIELFGEKRLDI